MIKEVKVSYRGINEYPEAGYAVSLNSAPLPVLPRKGQVITIFNGAGKRQPVQIKKRSVRCEGDILHVAFDVLEVLNA